MLTTVRDLARAMTSRKASKINSQGFAADYRVIINEKYCLFSEETFFPKFCEFVNPIKYYNKYHTD